jgi:hypothetical protein
MRNFIIHGQGGKKFSEYCQNAIIFLLFEKKIKK